MNLVGIFVDYTISNSLVFSVILLIVSCWYCVCLKKSYVKNPYKTLKMSGFFILFDILYFI